MRRFSERPGTIGYPVTVRVLHCPGQRVALAGAFLFHGILARCFDPGDELPRRRVLGAAQGFVLFARIILAIAISRRFARSCGLIKNTRAASSWRWPSPCPCPLGFTPVGSRIMLVGWSALRVATGCGGRVPRRFESCVIRFGLRVCWRRGHSRTGGPA